MKLWQNGLISLVALVAIIMCYLIYSEPLFVISINKVIPYQQLNSLGLEDTWLYSFYQSSSIFQIETGAIIFGFAR